MGNLIYSYSLCAAISLMLFISMYFLFGKTPDKPIYNIYVSSRRTMAIAILLLAINYCIHYFTGIRFWDPAGAILINLATYFFCYWLFIFALNRLINRFQISRRRFITHITLCVIYAFMALAVKFCIPEESTQKMAIIGMAFLLLIYGLFLSYRILHFYRRAIKLLDDSVSDDLSVYLRWMNRYTYYTLSYGIACGLFTFLPKDYVFLWILSSLPLYIYLFCSYQNYLLFYEQVETVFVSDTNEYGEPDNEPLEAENTVSNQMHDMPQSYYIEIGERIEEWIKNDGYVQQGMTIKDLADMLHTNRTYLSKFINTTYKTTFRNWITDMRINFAKKRMTENPDLLLSDIAESSGFMSLSHFMKTFKEKEGYSPAKWRKTHYNNSNL